METKNKKTNTKKNVEFLVTLAAIQQNVERLDKIKITRRYRLQVRTILPQSRKVGSNPASVI